MYSSTNNKNQTIKSSGCFPTSAAMVISASKGIITPPTISSLMVDNNYRTASNGTAWSANSFIADYFDFKEYHTTSNFDKAMDYLKQKRSDGTSKYYIIASCGSGLFTTSGHYIVLTSSDNNTITVYDPYLYSGKFSTASRKKANVTVKGNSVYVTEKNFKKYANYKNFWIFSNDSIVKSASKKSTTKTYTRYVKVNTSLNVRKKASKNAKIVDKLKNNTKVTVYETKNGFSRIGTNKWISSKYLTSSKPKSTTIKNTVGQYKRLKTKTTLYSKSNLSGKKYNYLKNTQVKIVKNISKNVDYVQVVKTKRYAYVKNNAYK